MSWTDEKIALLKKLYQEGKSSAEIARQLGNVTRNAVIGKVHRLGLVPRVNPRNQLGFAGKRKKLRRNKPTQAQNPWPLLGKASLSSVPTAPYVEQITDETPQRNLMELGPGECRWPIGDPRKKGFGFCGCKVVPGTPYCDAHRTKAYLTPSAKRPISEPEPAGESVRARDGEDVLN